MMADLRENNSKLVLELQAGAGSAASHSTITMRRDQSTGANQFQRMHKIADAVQDLGAQPKLFAIVSGKTVPDDVLESMKNPHATPGAWRTKSPSKASHYQKLPQPPKVCLAPCAALACMLPSIQIGGGLQRRCVGVSE